MEEWTYCYLFPYDWNINIYHHLLSHKHTVANVQFVYRHRQ